jgi:hypothetical protein
VAVVAHTFVQKAQRLYKGLHGIRDAGWIEHLDVFGVNPPPLPLPPPLPSPFCILRLN